MMNTKESKQGYASFGYTDGRTHFVNWTVTLGEPDRKLSMRHKRKRDHGRIHFLSIDVDGETEVLFKNGGWVSRPPLLNRMIKTYTNMLIEMYN